jgi:hypothetical protein
MLRLRLLLPEERFIAGGRIAIGPRDFEDWSMHVRALERVRGVMLDLVRRLEEGPVPDQWQGEQTETGSIIDDDPDPIQRGLRRFFYQYIAHRRIEFSHCEDQHLSILDPAPTTPAHLTGIHVWIPNPMFPETVLRVDPTLTPRATVVDLWLDEHQRYFYLSHGHRNYIVDTEGQFRAH